MAALPPLAVARPPTLHGTMPVYCHEVASTKSLPLVALNPLAHAPDDSFGCMKPLEELNTFRQSWARLANWPWVAVSPIAPANAEMAKSAVSYSSVVDTSP